MDEKKKSRKGGLEVIRTKSTANAFQNRLNSTKKTRRNVKLVIRGNKEKANFRLIK